MFNKKRKMTWEDLVFENLNKGIDELDRAATCVGRGRFQEAEKHYENSHLRQEVHQALCGDFSNVRDSVKNLFKRFF